MNNRIRNEFPYPLAKAYLRAVNADEPVERFTLVGYLFEVTLKFISAVSIAEYIQSRRRDESVNRTLLGINRPSLGNWAGFLRETLRFDITQKTTVLSDQYFKKNPDLKKLVAAVNAINEYLSPDRPSSIGTASPEMFVNSMVNYRNKTKGHGAIQKRDCVMMNPILFDAVEEFMLSFPLILDYELALVRKIEVDKRNNYVHQLEKMDGTDIIKTAYIAAQPDPNIRAGHIALCRPEGDQIRPFLSMHPIFIFLDDKEDVYVLNEGEGARIEYLCYHRGGRDAIYTPDELKEDFAEFFGDILKGKEEMFETAPPAAPPPLREARPTRPPREPAPAVPSVEKKPEALPPQPARAAPLPPQQAAAPAPIPAKKSSVGGLIGIVVALAVIAAVAYVVLAPKTGEPAQTPPAAVTQPVEKTTQPAAATEKKEAVTSTTTPSASKAVPSAKAQSSTTGQPPSTTPPPVVTPPTYFAEGGYDSPPMVVGGSNRVHDYIDMSSLHMSPSFRGTVQVRAYVNETGGIDRTEVTQGIDPRFDGAAANAVHQLRFTPARKAGQAVKSQTTLSIVFQGRPEPSKKQQEEATPPPP